MKEDTENKGTSSNFNRDIASCVLRKERIQPVEQTLETYDRDLRFRSNFHSNLVKRRKGVGRWAGGAGGLVGWR